MGEPARGYSWRRFEPGDEVRLTHGGYTEKRVGPLAEEIEAEVAEAAPWCGRDAFAPARRRYARAEAVAEMIWRHVAEVGVIDENGEVRAVVGQLARWEGAAAHRAAALGLDLVAFTRVIGQLAAVPGTDAADILDHLAGEGAAALARRSEAPGAPRDPTPVPGAGEDHDGHQAPGDDPETAP